MCGIAGTIGHPATVVADMIYSLDHRGPDAHGSRCVGDGVYFGHARLAIIDTSPAGNQPMRFGRWWITYNGEIYNYRELRQHLESKGERFTTQTDTEVLLRMWAVYGPQCLDALDGMFAFAVYDTEKRELTLVRDRAGEKPLYWTDRGAVFAFASELRPLIGIAGRDIANDSLALYALYRYVPAPRTIISGISKLPAGHLMVVKADGSHQISRWYSWEVEPAVAASAQGFTEVCDEVDDALAASVKRRLVSDVPLGMFLSGGIDSSLTAAMAVRLGHTPKTFSIGFEGKDSEHEQARRIAKHLGTEHREQIFGASEVERVCRDLGSHMDEPNGDRSCAPTYLLSQFAKSEVTVALSGDGGDELFGGYGRYFGDCRDGAEYYNHRLPVYANSYDCPGEISSTDVLFRTYADHIHALRALDFNRYLPGCVLSKMDRMSMQHSLEVRTPFLEPTLLDIARKLPTAYVMNGDMGKLVLREIAGRYLPRDIALAPKRGFGMPKAVFEGNQRLMAELYEDAAPHCERVGMPKPPQNINAIWAFIVLGQWVRSLQ